MQGLLYIRTNHPETLSMKTWAFITAILCLHKPLSAQNTRLSDHNVIGWYNHFITLKLKDKWSLHGEYQWRRTDLLLTWQQGLLRTGINYQAHPKLQLRLGYAWAETFAYGDYPLQVSGKTFTEHRTYQMATLTDKPGRLETSHRFMLEQRWVGRYTNPSLEKEDKYVYTNRGRYMFRAQLPLNKMKTEPGAFYLAGYDEIMIGFGKNVQANVFDQNRLVLLAGYQFPKWLRLEAGYLNQIIQFGRQVNNRPIFQYNNGVIVNLNWTLPNLMGK